jgi:hypothetical protein
VKVLKTREDGTKKDCSNKFGFGLNDVYVSPKDKFDFKLFVLPGERMSDGQYMLEVNNLTTGVTTWVSLGTVVKEPKVEKRVTLRRGEDGTLRARTY